MHFGIRRDCGAAFNAHPLATKQADSNVNVDMLAFGAHQRLRQVKKLEFLRAVWKPRPQPKAAFAGMVH